MVSDCHINIENELKYSIKNLKILINSYTIWVGT